MAQDRRFQMTRTEVDEIFLGIPRLVKFHRTFYHDLSQGSNIGRMFVRLIDYFKGYTEYMKNCAKTIQKMRDYIEDKIFWTCLKEIRASSRRRKDDMIDLLLAPLDRIMDYNDLLNTLLPWADKMQHYDYQFLRKASCRMCRIAKYIAQYKHGILNRNEMNKIQIFLGEQCWILSSKRRILRRGVIIRKTARWPPRKKSYVFLLFNDILAWATSEGELQSTVELRRCTLKPSDAKTNRDRKFKVLVSAKLRRNKGKTLLLECSSRRQRDEWYSAMELAISTLKNVDCNIPTSSSLKIYFSTKSVSNSEDEQRTEALVKKTPRREDHANMVELEKGRIALGYTPEEEDKCFDSDSSFEQADVTSENNYEDSHNFIIQEFKDFATWDETESQISEFDHEFGVEYKGYQDIRNGLSTTPPDESLVMKIHANSDMAPVTLLRNSFSSSGDQISLRNVLERRKLGKMSLREFEGMGNSRNITPSPRTQYLNQISRSSIIRRLSSKVSQEAYQRLECSSSIKIRLDDGKLSTGSSEMNLERSSIFAIRLNEFGTKLGECV